MSREYVIVAQQYQKGDILVFWGSQTKDSQERSFSGYTEDFNVCEKYSIEDIKKSGYGFKIYELDNFNYRTQEHFVIKRSDLEKLGVKAKTVYKY